jgi:hypothetical protein
MKFILILYFLCLTNISKGYSSENNMRNKIGKRSDQHDLKLNIENSDALALNFIKPLVYKDSYDSANSDSIKLGIINKSNLNKLKAKALFKNGKKKTEYQRKYYRNKNI